MTPLFTHDCDDCEHLGTHVDEDDGTVDLYVHRRASGDDDLIARYGNEGWEYRCFPRSAAEGHAKRYPDGIYAELIRRAG